MANNKRHYYRYKAKNSIGILNLKSKLNPLPEGYEEIDEETFIALSNLTKLGGQNREKRKQINELKAKLMATDYKVAKRAEGYYTDEEWAAICAERRTWRDRINELEEELKNA